MPTTDTTTTRPNPLDAAMPAELLERGRQATAALEALLPAAVTAAVHALEVEDAMAANGHTLSDDDFDKALPGSVCGVMIDAGARLAAVVNPNRPDGGRTHLQDMARTLASAQAADAITVGLGAHRITGRAEDVRSTLDSVRDLAHRELDALRIVELEAEVERLRMIALSIGALVGLVDGDGFPMSATTIDQVAEVGS